ncbi:hypothetical protein GOP47_0008646 [Adiantum capillus-veneris]|uniref:Uncharacterized protein n=1 Tax=Adiantum capillus-veneris TaxID=13818 RepID=A0A9D4UZ91_ADICA|nr:hypothetical protein GOP47_0008646 [Adiantum capillus-veneris]
MASSSSSSRYVDAEYWGHFSCTKPLCATLGVRKALLWNSRASGSIGTHIVNCTQNGVESLATAVPEQGYVPNRRSSPLTRGGTLRGDKAAGRDPGLAVLGKVPARFGSFQDERWRHGTWDLSKFRTANRNVDWDAVIDAEVLRRKWLEEKPEASLNEDPVIFRMAVIPWWAWVRRFHLPEAELVNGRAAMVGFVVGFLVDALTGMGFVDQTGSSFGKFLLLVCVPGVMLIRRIEDVEGLKQLTQEWSFYRKQWQSAWQDEEARPVSKEEK